MKYKLKRIYQKKSILESALMTCSILFLMYATLKLGFSLGQLYELKQNALSDYEYNMLMEEFNHE